MRLRLLSRCLLDWSETYPPDPPSETEGGNLGLHRGGDGRRGKRSSENPPWVALSRARDHIPSFPQKRESSGEVRDGTWNFQATSKVALFVGWLLALGCAQESEELVLARVDGAPITASEFRDFDARIPAGMKEGGQRQVLESLIDKKLLLREADAANMAEDSWFKGELARFKRARLMALYMEREVVAKIEITPEEIERYYRESGRHRALRLGGIMVESLEEAGAIIDQLAAGDDFHELASVHSVHERTAARGGDTGIYQTRDQMSAETVEQVLGLALGDVSAPVREVFGHEDFYVIYKVLDEIPAPLSASERIIVEELTVQKREERRQVLRDSLVQAYAPVPRPVAIQRLVENGVMADQAEVLCAYRGGELTVSGFLEAYELLTGRSLQTADSAHVAEFLHRRVLPDLFVSAEIEAAGLAEDERFKETVAFKSEELMLSALRRREVDQYVSVTEEEVRDFYDAHPEKFARPENTTIVEILVASDSLAQRLGDELRTGGDAAALAQHYTRREGSLHHGGQMQLNAYTQGLFPVLSAAVREVAVGEVGGPLKTERGYSVFKVLERTREQIPYNAESQRRARAYVRIDKSKRDYVRFVRNLRNKYPVEIVEGSLGKL